MGRLVLNTTTAALAAILIGNLPSIAYSASTSNGIPGAIPVELPCEESSDTAPDGLLKKCSKLKPVAVETIDKMITLKAACLAQGQNVSLTSGSGGCRGQGSTPMGSGLTTCNLSLGSDPSSSTQSKLNLGSSSQSGCNSTGQLDRDSGRLKVGRAEQEFFYEGYVQALRSCRDRILNDIRQTNTFVGTSCGKMAAQDVNNLTKQLTGTDDFDPEFKKLVEAGSVEKYCTDLTKSGTQGNVSVADKAKHEIAVCQLSAARTNIESLFNRMATCEIIERAQNAWKSKKAQIDSAIMGGVVQPCLNSATSYAYPKSWDKKCKSTKNGGKVCWMEFNESRFKSLRKSRFDSCYKGDVREGFEKSIQQLFPYGGEGC